MFSLSRRLELRGTDAILLPCFVSQTYMHELQPNISTPIVSLMAALLAKIVTVFPHAKRIGVLTSSYVRDKNLFGQTFGGSHEIIYPDADAQRELMDVVYADGGIQSGKDAPVMLQKLQSICEGLAKKAATFSFPASPNFP